jgi:succinoglycan biosynthesis protein ExoV
MKLHYYRDSSGNFGDDLNEFIFPRLIPDILDADASSLLVGIGTILNDEIPTRPKKYVFGAGCGYGALPLIDDQWQVYCVRGPLTAERLGLTSELAITDPALLIRLLVEDRPRAPGRVVFVPHHVTAFLSEIHELSLEEVCSKCDIGYVDPRSDVEAVLDEIGGAELVIAEAMHGAITADALRVPWVPVRIADQVLDFKWRDWCGSIETDYEPLSLRAFNSSSAADLTAVLQQAKKASGVLSRERLADEHLSRLHEKLELLRSDYLNVQDRDSAPDKVGSETGPEPDGAAVKESWWGEILEATRVITAIVPRGSSFILVDDGQWLLDQDVAGRHVLRFRDDPDQWEPPLNDEDAIAALTRLRDQGAEWIVFPRTAFWWLDYYSELRRHLQARYRCAQDDERLVIYDLKTSQ